VDRVSLALQRASRALERFEEVMDTEPVTDIVRDAAIHRFEFTFEALWKAARQVLVHAEGLECASPKAVIRACRDVKLLTDQESQSALQMADDRNLTIHTYDEELARALYQRLFGDRDLMQKWLDRLQARV